jgi:hypothetical protein
MQVRLRCECGREILVTTGDAGASLACACGRTVEVPSLEEFRKLPAVAPPADEEPPGSLFGAVLVVGGALLCCVGLGLLLGNVTGLFPTFPFAGFIVMTVGGAIVSAGSRI